MRSYIDVDAETRECHICMTEQEDTDENFIKCGACGWVQCENCTIKVIETSGEHKCPVCAVWLIMDSLAEAVAVRKFLKKVKATSRRIRRSEWKKAACDALLVICQCAIAEYGHISAQEWGEKMDGISKAAVSVSRVFCS